MHATDLNVRTILMIAGFTTDRVPAGYYDLSNLKKGMCILRIEEPTILNLHPWTVVARVRGQNVELSSSTTDNLFIFEIESEKSEYF